MFNFPNIRITQSCCSYSLSSSISFILSSSLSTARFSISFELSLISALISSSYSLAYFFSHLSFPSSPHQFYLSCLYCPFPPISLFLFISPPKQISHGTFTMFGYKSSLGSLLRLFMITYSIYFSLKDVQKGKGEGEGVETCSAF